MGKSKTVKSRAGPMGRIPKNIIVVAAVFTVVVSLVYLFDKISDCNRQANMLEILRSENNEAKRKNEILTKLLIGLITDKSLSLTILEGIISPSVASEIEAKASQILREQLPFALSTRFYPSGWMGDGELGEKHITYRNRAGIVDGRETIVTELVYRKGSKGWAGIYWQYPDSNWGKQPGRNLLGAKKITFLAKGAKGGEIVEFKSGGIRGKFSDTYEISLGKVVLQDEWKKYTLDLSDSDLSSVIGAFAWVVAASDNEPGEVRTYLAELRVE